MHEYFSEISVKIDHFETFFAMQSKSSLRDCSKVSGHLQWVLYEDCRQKMISHDYRWVISLIWLRAVNTAWKFSYLSVGPSMGFKVGSGWSLTFSRLNTLAKVAMNR